MSTTNHNMRTFYTIVLTQVFSLIGSRISALAISIHVFNETQNATPLALVMFFMIVPHIALSGLAGALADRFDRRYLMVLADVGQAGTTLLLLLSFATGSFQLWHLYVLTALQSIFAVFQAPAFMASITMLVPDEQRDRANAIQQMTGPMADIIAPVIAGLVFAVVGVVGAILIDLGTFLVAVAVIALSNIPRPEQTEEGALLKGSLFKEMFDGFRYLWRLKPILGMVLFFAFVNFLATSLSALQTPYILARTGDPALLGLLLAVSSVGALTGGIVYSVWGGTRPRIHTMMVGILVVALMLILLGLAQSGLVLGLVFFLFMLPLPMINASAMSILQAKIPPDVQGRVFATVSQISMLMMPIATLLVGPLADQVFEPAVGTAGWDAVAPLVGNGFGAGMGLMIALAGVIAVAATVVVYALPAVRHMEAKLPDFAPAAAPEPAPQPGDALAGVRDTLAGDGLPGIAGAVDPLDH